MAKKAKKQEQKSKIKRQKIGKFKHFQKAKLSDSMNDISYL